VAEVAARPRSPWVADLVGVNLYRGRAASGRVHVAGSEAALVVASAADGEVFAAFHPRAVTLHLHQPEGSARNAFPGRVTAVDREGSRARVTIDGPLAVVAEVTPAALDELGLGEGTPVWASVKATEIDVYT
jgi:molybdate transport system ATP-binding protein